MGAAPSPHSRVSLKAEVAHRLRAGWFNHPAPGDKSHFMISMADNVPHEAILVRQASVCPSTTISRRPNSDVIPLYSCIETGRVPRLANTRQNSRPQVAISRNHTKLRGMCS